MYVCMSILNTLFSKTCKTKRYLLASKEETKTTRVFYEFFTEEIEVCADCWEIIFTTLSHVWTPGCDHWCLRVAWPPPTEVLSACGHTQPRPRHCPGWPAWGRSPARPDLAASVIRPRGPGGRIRRSEAGWGHSGLMLATAAELLRFRPLANISH